MIPSKIRILVLCAALAACREQPAKIASLHEAMPLVPLPPQATFVSKTGSADALQITMHSSATPDAIAAYYRGELPRAGWHLVSDQRDNEGATVLFAERKGPPLWIRVQPAADGKGTLVQLSGAIVTPRDTTGAKPTS